MKIRDKKINVVNNQSNVNDDTGKEIINTEVSKSNLHDYNDHSILGRDNITIIGHQVTHVAFKDCPTFIKCVTKIGGTTIDHA